MKTLSWYGQNEIVLIDEEDYALAWAAEKNWFRSIGLDKAVIDAMVFHSVEPEDRDEMVFEAEVPEEIEKILQEWEILVED